MWLAKLFEVGVKVSKVSRTYGLQLCQPSPHAWFNTSGKSRRRHCMQEIKAVSSDSNQGAPNIPKPVHPPPKLILRVATRTGKKEKLYWRKKKWIACLFICDGFYWVFNYHCTQSRRFCSKRIFLLVNATQLDLASVLQSLGPVLVHPPQINFTRGHASWEKGKTLLAQKEIDRVCVYLFVMFMYWVFNSHCAQSRRFCSKRIFLLVNATQLDLVCHYNYWVLY